MTSRYKVIGLMSGTSLDGLDIAYCEFNIVDGKWNFTINKASTLKYPKNWINTLQKVEDMSAREFAQAHVDYGYYLGQKVSGFIKKHELKPHFVSSHGHTIFHQPDHKLSFQLGSGAALAGACKLSVISDFRSVDVSLGGQGAPLVPIGDKLLFSDYDYCLNLGGIANISFEHKSQRIAFDICPANMALNYLASTRQLAYDDGGKIAASGKLNKTLLQQLNSLKYYKQNTPKSLGKEWFITEFKPLLDSAIMSTEDKLNTVSHHIASQVANTLVGNNKNVLITGGGAHNSYLISTLKNLSPAQIFIPQKQLIDFKEALIFAFLGVLRFRNETNCLKSVTGAKLDNIGGSIYAPF